MSVSMLPAVVPDSFVAARRLYLEKHDETVELRAELNEARAELARVKAVNACMSLTMAQCSAVLGTWGKKTSAKHLMVG